VLFFGLALVEHDRAGTCRKALALLLANACVIAAYTVVDCVGVRALGNAFSYAATLFLFEGLPYMALVPWRVRP
jgi:hypothetical protein